jgi:uncharacterized protein YfiM (DUF2279 family)
MIRLTLIILALTVAFLGKTQGSFFSTPDSLNKGRLIGVSVGVGSVWTGSMIGLSQVWYADSEKTNWHAFDDSKDWLQMDKVGHYYTAYKLNQLTTDMFRWTGFNRRKSLWIGTGVSLGYQTTLEMLDAYSADWGFSWADMLSNGLGTASYMTQQLIWDEERFIPKFSYFPTKYAAVRPEILGSSFTQSFLKDYNGQIYWLSFSPGTFMKNSKFPEWACISIGYGIDQKLVGSEEYYLDPATGNEYFSSREILLSLDIDFSKIAVKKPWLKALLKQFNYLKVPFPAVGIRNGKVFGSVLGY